MRPARSWLLPVLLAASLVSPASPPSSREIRAYQSGWEDAVEEYGKGRFDRASRRLEALDGGDALASIYRSVFLARARLAAGDTLRADAALAAALVIAADSPGVRRDPQNALRDPQSAPRDPVWLRHLHRQRVQLSAAHPPAARKACLRAALAAPLDNADRAEALYRLLELDSTGLTRAERNGALRQLIPLALPGSRLDTVYRRWLAFFPPVDTAWEEQRLALDLEERLGLWSAAIARATAMQPRARDAEAAKSLQVKIALWHYEKGSYVESVKQYSQYRERHGDTPEILLQLARAHRALSQDARAQEWYSRLVARFPRDPRSAEILWMRAFDDETLGRADTALAAYARIARDFPQHARSGEAMFRTGWLHYKRGDFGAAARAFAALRLAGKSGRLTGAARYWEGKALSRPGDSVGAAAARAAWASLVREYPFGHYGHAAREELVRSGALPDSLEWGRLLNRAEGDSARAWLPAASSGAGNRAAPVAREGFGESPWLPVSKLFALGLDTLAVLTLQARADAAPADLRLVYDAAVRCRAAGFDYEAYRFALRLSERLPLEQWPAAPAGVLRLFYPPSYAHLARPEAERAGLPPQLALALIKQESGFDPNAVSRAGARGLMQLMPATGTEQARKEGMAAFHPDSLFDPAVNVRLGVAYLRDVLRRHDGNVAFALAHYNAGPAALARWQPRLEGRPFEAAAEDIGYAETREYVKRVNANYRTYQVLWGEVK